MGDVPFPTGEEIIQADDLVALIEKPFAKMGAKEACPAGDQNTHARKSTGAVPEIKT
jgi:hypothetical protein